MRRKDFLRLAGLEEGTFKVMLARKHVPQIRPRNEGGWNDYSADDVLAVEAAAELAREGAKRSDARDWVEIHGAVALEWGSAGSKANEGAFFLGAAPIRQVTTKGVVHDSYHPLIGTISVVADEMQRLQSALGGKHRVGGALLCNLNLCVEVIAFRAKALGIVDERLNQLVEWFQ